jgi:hypothetical protein
MNMSVAKLTKLGACSDGIQYFKDNKFKTIEQAILSILKTDHPERFNWSSWLIVTVINKNSRIRYAIYAAEQVLPIFEKKYPEDKTPRKVIQAAKRYLKKPSEENKERCKIAALDAMSDEAYWVAKGATDAYYVVATATKVAQAAYAPTYTSTYAAIYANGAANNKNETFKKIIRYGLKLIKDQNK